MDDQREAVSATQMQAVNSLGAGLFPLGRVVATPAALALLERVGVFPAAILAWHHHGEWGNLDEHDRAANNNALKNGSRLLSSYEFDGEKVWVITEAVNDAGTRASTCILLPRDY